LKLKGDDVLPSCPDDRMKPHWADRIWW